MCNCEPILLCMIMCIISIQNRRCNVNSPTASINVCLLMWTTAKEKKFDFIKNSIITRELYQNKRSRVTKRLPDPFGGEWGDLDHVGPIAIGILWQKIQTPDLDPAYVTRGYDFPWHATEDTDDRADDVGQGDGQHVGFCGIDKQSRAGEELEARLGGEPDDHGGANQGPAPIAACPTFAKQGNGQQHEHGGIDSRQSSIGWKLGHADPNGKRNQYGRETHARP